MEFYIFQPSDLRRNQVTCGPFGNQQQAEERAIQLHRDDNFRETMVLQKVSVIRNTISAVRS